MMELIINPQGSVRCIYDEAIDLNALGTVCICRASHVEPDAQSNWWADLSPVGGPKLGPYGYRRKAIAAEMQWLQKHWFCA
jgi:hypothetical protein